MIRFWGAAYVLTHRLAYIRFGTACIYGGVVITGSTNLQLDAIFILKIGLTAW